MPGLPNLPQTQLGPVTDAGTDIANAVKCEHEQILETFPSAIFMYGLGTGIAVMICIIGLLWVLIDRFFRKEHVKTVKFGPRFPDLQGGDKFFIEQKNGMIYGGLVLFHESDYYEIKSDEAMDQKLDAIPLSTLEGVEMEESWRKSKREMRKEEEDCEYGAFMSRFSMESFASFVDDEDITA